MNRLQGYITATGEESVAERTEEFVRLLSKYQSLIRGFLITLLPNRTEADDLFQRTSIVLWRKFDQFQDGSDFGAWACQIAKLEVRNFLRVGRRDRLCFSDELLTSLADMRLALDNELELRREALRHCVAKLRPNDKKIIHSCYGPQATTVTDAADHLGRPVNTLYKALIRIRRALFECIERTLRTSER
jgi:RNA polymerase sigma-70 factor (ECF subfamily)